MKEESDKEVKSEMCKWCGKEKATGFANDLPACNICQDDVFQGWRAVP